MIDCTFGPGFLHYADQLEVDDPTARIWIPLAISSEGQTLTVHAVLDTGADWSVLKWEIAQALGIRLGSGQRMPYSTRAGDYDGELIRHTVQLLSENTEVAPSSLDVEVTIWVSKEWHGPCFIGYNGFLDRLRFAVDPAERVFFFGRSG